MHWRLMVLLWKNLWALTLSLTNRQQPSGNAHKSVSKAFRVPPTHQPYPR